MLKAVITYLNLKLSLLNYFDLTRCLVELKEQPTDDGNLRQPVEYISNGDFDVINFDEFNGVSYWRLREEPSTERTETRKYRAGAKNNVETTIPLKLVFAVPRTKLTEDDAYSFDAIRQTMVKQFTVDDGTLKTQLGASSVRITQVGSNSNPKEVWEEETEGTGTFEPKYETVFGSIDVDVVIISDHECLPTECDDVESDIIRAFDWCGNTALTIGRLTPAQQTCISDYLCGIGDPVQIQVNGVDTEQAEAGSTYNQEIQNSGGVDVGTSANPSVVADSTVTLNGESLGATGSIVAEGSVDIPVTQDGSPVGSWDGSSFVIPLCGSGPSLTIEFQNSGGSVITEADLGDTIDIIVTTSDITPNNYTFAITNGTDSKFFNQAGNTLSWAVDLLGDLQIMVSATDGSGATSLTSLSTFTVNLNITNSVSLDGVNDYLFGYSIPKIDADFSVSMSVKMLDTGRDNAFLAIHADGQSRPQFLCGYEDNSQEIRVASWNQEWGNNGVAITPDTDWHDLAVTYDLSATTLKVYWDAVEIYSSSSWGLNYGFNFIRFGWAADWPFVGGKYGNIRITDMRTHDAELTPSEVSDVANGNLSGHETTLFPITESVGKVDGHITDIINNQRLDLLNITAPYGIVNDAP